MAIYLGCIHRSIVPLVLSLLFSLALAVWQVEIRSAFVAWPKKNYLSLRHSALLYDLWFTRRFGSDRSAGAIMCFRILAMGFVTTTVFTVIATAGAMYTLLDRNEPFHFWNPFYFPRGFTTAFAYGAWYGAAGLIGSMIVLIRRSGMMLYSRHHTIRTRAKLWKIHAKLAGR